MFHFESRNSKKMTNARKIASETKCTIVVVGDSRTGKSALLHRFVNHKFQPVYMPTSFDKSFGQQEVNKHLVHFSFWDTSGSPAYDSVRPLSYQEADVFLLCYKISDPISLYNVKNKWIRELRSHRPDVPVILCGCQSDLRQDSATLNHLSKTGRTPVSSDQALAICCEIEAVNYVETSAKFPTDNNNGEAFELAALAALKTKNSSSGSSTSGTFKRSPSLNSSLSLFEPLQHEYTSCNNNNNQRRHQLRNSYRLVAPPPLNSPSSFSECDARLSTFSPEPLSRIPPSIAENEAYQSDTNMSVCSFQTFQPSMPSPCEQKQKRPTSLALGTAQRPLMTLITPTGDPQKRLYNLSESNNNAMIRPNCLTRRTSYRTYQKVPIPVAAPMSPVGSEYSLDLKSNNSSSCFSPLPRPLESVDEDMTLKTYESLKSTCSSQNSSKASSTSSDLSSYKPISEADSETTDPNLIKSLNFVSPKTGVYRPMPEGSRRYKQSCLVM